MPHLSVAVHVTGVVVIGKVLPDGGMQVMVGAGSELSVAVGVKVTTAIDEL